MSDLISREAVLKIVSERKKAYETSIKDDYIDGGLDACEEIEEVINNIPSQNEWISTKKQLPDKDGIECIIFDKGNKEIPSNILIATFENDKKSKGEWDDRFWNDDYHLVNVTHWQPLPQPPLLYK